MKNTRGFGALALVAALTVAGCGDDSSTSNDSTSSTTSSRKTDHNDADVTFARSMLPHHQQAVEMAELAQENASSPEVKQLADTIEGAQGPEIGTMTGWLRSWGKKVPSGSMSGMAMTGMMSDADMTELEAASGRAFDRLFLTMMVRHHTGAIEMARDEETEGAYPGAVALAKRIEADQSAQIAVMKRLTGS